MQPRRRYAPATQREGLIVSENFRDSLLGVLPSLRAYALVLARSDAAADDLVQDTLMRAWRYRASYLPGTNFKAWIFKILRNQRCSQARISQRHVEDVDGRLASRLVSLPEQEWRLRYAELLRGLDRLPGDLREALLLVAGSGLSYEAAAEIVGCSVAALNSRVSRARRQLARFVEGPPAPVGENVRSFAPREPRTLLNHYDRRTPDHVQPQPDC